MWNTCGTGIKISRQFFSLLRSWTSFMDVWCSWQPWRPDHSTSRGELKLTDLIRLVRQLLNWLVASELLYAFVIFSLKPPWFKRWQPSCDDWNHQLLMVPTAPLDDWKGVPTKWCWHYLPRTREDQILFKLEVVKVWAMVLVRTKRDWSCRKMGISTEHEGQPTVLWVPDLRQAKKWGPMNQPKYGQDASKSKNTLHASGPRLKFEWVPTTTWIYVMCCFFPFLWEHRMRFFRTAFSQLIYHRSH